MSTPSRPVVALNTLAVNPSNAGSRTMMTELVPALVEVAPHLEILLICHQGNRSLYPAELDAIMVDLGSGRVGQRVLYDLFRVAKTAERRADVLINPSNIGPLRCSIPQVAVCAAHLVLPSCQRAALPEQMPWAKRQYLGWPYRRHIRGADRVLGISEFLTQGLVDELGVDPGRARPMSLGVTMPDFDPSGSKRTNDILFVGTLYKYKEGETAVRAFAAARDELPDDARLVLVGKDRKGEAAHLAGMARSLGVADGVDIRGSVPADELTSLFETAGVLLMPSLCEGFGLPVAEAMSYGMPVIAADATSLPGVAGGAARLVAPKDAPGFARALVEVLNDGALREELSRKGVARARELSWAAAARSLRDAVDEVLAESGRSSPRRPQDSEARA